MSNLAELKKTACDAIDKERAALKTVSQHIWEKPELAYQEHHAHKLLTDYLKKRAFKVRMKHPLKGTVIWFLALFGLAETTIT